jgi:hypothetical protein
MRSWTNEREKYWGGGGGGGGGGADNKFARSTWNWPTTKKLFRHKKILAAASKPPTGRYCYPIVQKNFAFKGRRVYGRPPTLNV